MNKSFLPECLAGGVYCICKEYRYNQLAGTVHLKYKLAGIICGLQFFKLYIYKIKQMQWQRRNYRH